MSRMRSSLGGHFAGSGMSYPYGYNLDEIRVINIPEHRKGCKLSTDGKRKNKEFDAYCKEQSGKVVSYNIKDLQK